MDKKENIARLKEIDHELVLYQNITALLSWDQETNMPESGVEGRSEQMSLMQGVLHDKITSSEIGDLLNGLGASEQQPSGDASFTDQERGLIREYFREYNREKKIPKKLVQEIAVVTSKAQPAWVEARKSQDFSIFQPHLEKIVALTRETTECLGYKDHPYDPLIDQYEPGMTTAEVARVFSGVKKDIVALLGKIAEKGQVDDSFLYEPYDNKLQDDFGRKILTDMGFDFQRGILTESAHPFTTGVGKDDIRITTRYNEPLMSSSLFSTIHEGGHALYEMGAASPELKGTSLGTGISLAVHESQSRFWENIVARSDDFWTNYYSSLQGMFPVQLGSVSQNAFVRGINKVEPSMIRVNADEVTYSLHIILRFELETALVNGELEVKDLPEAWNEKMRQMLGIVPGNSAEGVLQDVHWSAGLIGYFPTYALGNLFSAQFLETLKQEIPNYLEYISSGNLLHLQKWLDEKIYRKGGIYTATEVLQQVTGKPLDPSHFSRYLEDKYTRIYDL
ncbi:MAG: carboxypeptidase M32 [Bacteroidetes bacterium]|nr:carboxypeptidase M32 [Bacteroidota bacterium]